MIRMSAIVGVLILVVGCDQQPTTTLGDLSESATTVVFNAENAPTVEFSVPDMMCEQSCAAQVREILAEQDGVKDVKIDFPAKVAIVAVDGKTFDTDKALDDLIDHSFDNSTLKGGE